MSLQKRTHAWVAILCAGALAGCATQPTVEQYAPSRAVCCKSLSELPFRSFAPGQEVEFTFNESTPAYDFSGRRQHFVALQIPESLTPTAIQVRTYLSGTFIWNMSAVVPEFVFLDAKHQVLATRPTENFQRASGFWRSAVSGRVVVPAETRYLVVKPADGSSGVPVIHSDNGTPGRVNPAALGDFSLRLFGEPRK